MSEVERRRELVRLVGEGVPVARAARELERSRQWAHKWLARYEVDGPGGLIDLSRAPISRPTELDEATVRKVIEVRRYLKSQRHASVGGLTILARLEDAGWEPLPSERSIERVLSRYGLTEPGKNPRRSGPKNKIPSPKVAGRPGVYQQADWIQDRYLEGGFLFNSLQISDVGSHMITAGQYTHRYVQNSVRELVEVAWPQMSIPQAIMTDNAFIKTSHYNPWTAWTKTCLYHGVEVIVAPPGGLGWTNHIESVNNLWENRTIKRHHYPHFDALKEDSHLACHWFNHDRPILNPKTGTRYPARLVTDHHHQLRWPTLTITDIYNPTGECVLPLTHGRITFIRITQNQTIAVADTRWPVPLPDGSLVTATITTNDQTLTINHQGQPITSHHYPIHHKITEPLHPQADHSLLAHV